MIEIIKKNEEFQMIFEKGHSMNGKYLVAYFLTNQFGYNRFGFCVGKKIGIAVRRNRMKRLLREAVRTLDYSGKAGWDIVLVARFGMIRASLQNIILDIHHIFTKTGIIN